MPIKFILHADDIGLSPAINASILEAVDNGYVRSVSLICNGRAFDEAVEALIARPNVRISLHINLLEGEPVCPPHAIAELVGPDGQLAATFQGILWRWARYDRKSRQRLRDQIRMEAEAQMRRGIEKLGDRLDVLRVDGHTHVHALAVVRDAILEADAGRPIGYMRLPREPMHASLKGPDMRTIAGANLIKRSILDTLSRPLGRVLRDKGIAHNPALLGILHSGGMTPDAILAGASLVRRRLSRSDQVQLDEPVEVLIHPGMAAKSEAHFWDGRAPLWAFYSSNGRGIEQATARDERVGQLVGLCD